jgi:hypothetical protein
VVDLAGIDQVIALAATDIDAVPIVAVQRKARDGQRLALGAGLLDPVPAAPGEIAAIADLGDDAFQPDLAGVREHLFAVDLKAFAELDRGLLINFFRCILRSKSGSFRKSWPLR